MTDTEHRRRTRGDATSDASRVRRTQRRSPIAGAPGRDGGLDVRPVRMTAKRLGMLGAAVLMAGGALLGTAVAASAGTPTVSFSPNTAIGASQGVLVTASGFTKAPGGLAMCEIGISTEPTIADPTTGQA